jgi:hypothetical protein
MNSKELQKRLVDWTAKNSGHDFRRPYIGLSGIGDCERKIYDRVRNGNHISVEEHLRTRLSYELEEALQGRLRLLGIYAPGETITLFDGLVQGHTDGLLDGREILEIKTVPLREFLPGNKVPGRVYWQCQAYMHYLKRRFCHVVYLSRDHGQVKVFGLHYDEKLGVDIQLKVGRLVDAVLGYERPVCSCGKCDSANNANGEKKIRGEGEGVRG